MSLSLVDLLYLPTHLRTKKNILLNISCLKRKCDLFYHLADKEAFYLLQHCELHKYSSDLVIPEAEHNLCILLKGKVSLCHKVLNSVEVSDHEEETETVNNGDGGKRGSLKKPKSAGAASRRKTVVEIVTDMLNHRKSLIQAEEQKRRAALTAKRMSIVANAPLLEGASPDPPEDGSILPDVVMPTRCELYGKAILQYSDGSYFGGPDMEHHIGSGKNDRHVYVADTECMLILIPPDIQQNIVNAHYLSTIQDKQTFMMDNHVTRRLTKPQQSALLHEMLEEHFIYGNTLVERGKPSSTIFIIKSGFARVYFEVKIPKVTLGAAIQHLPSTKLQQRLKPVEIEVMDIGPGEIVGGLEQLYSTDKYLFTVRATTEMVAYNVRSAQFKELILKQDSKSLNVFTEELRKKFELRREMCDFSLSEDVNKVVSELLCTDTNSDLRDPMDVLKTEMFAEKSRRSIPYYMESKGCGQPVGDVQRMSTRAPNRGAFADRVRNRMIEMGFTSRR